MQSINKKRGCLGNFNQFDSDINQSSVFFNVLSSSPSREEMIFLMQYETEMKILQQILFLID